MVYIVQVYTPGRVGGGDDLDIPVNPSPIHPEMMSS